MAYRLELPPHIRVHNVFHVSLLKPYVPDNFLRISASVPIDETGTFEMVPECFLDFREKKLRGRIIREFLVKWKNYQIEDASWITQEELRQKFPHKVQSLNLS